MNELVVKVIGGEIEEYEKQAYIKYARDKFGKALKGLDIMLDRDEVILSYQFSKTPFERIARIYLD